MRKWVCCHQGHYMDWLYKLSLTACGTVLAGWALMIVALIIDWCIKMTIAFDLAQAGANLAAVGIAMFSVALFVFIRRTYKLHKRH